MMVKIGLFGMYVFDGVTRVYFDGVGGQADCLTDSRQFIDE
jgi:hypothetical protein